MPRVRLVGVLSEKEFARLYMFDSWDWLEYNRKKRMEKNTQLIYFTAQWCQPCKTFGPRIDRVSKDLGLPLVKIDADEHQDMIAEFQIMSIPTVIVMSDGAQADRLVGAKTEDQLRKSLEAYVG